MCGIAGILRMVGNDSNSLTLCARQITSSLAHRGPDASGIWADEAAGIALGHRRLSVLDLTEAGAQPMQSNCGRFVVTFNGEIYNHLELRKDLEAAGAAAAWRGHSDTETLLCAVQHWGIKAALQRFNGMFAIAIWDAREHTLTLCRDRFGEKPLFHGWVGEDFVFASELKAFAAHPQWSGTVDRQALTAFMRFGYVPGPSTIWETVKKLDPASFTVVSHPMCRGDVFPSPQPYWSMRQHVIDGQHNRRTDAIALVNELERLLCQAVTRQSLSDVPIGAFLSGGIDSSAIVALMQKCASRPIKTFSVGFAEKEFSEATHARGVASYLGTDHTELVVSPSDAREVIPQLAGIYDEPFGDSSQIPTLLLATLARREVTVALSGDAGDEMFGGYNRHVWGPRLHARFARLPYVIRLALTAAIRNVAPEPANRIGNMVGDFLPSRFRFIRSGDQLAKIGRIVNAGSFNDLYRLLSSVDDDPAGAVVDGFEPASWFDLQMAGIDQELDPLDRMTLSDALSYLTDDILQKVDRAAMSVSLETRVPFLDKDVVEFSCEVPPDYKVRNGEGKWLVRQVLDRHVPKSLIDRPKMGFAIPLDEWLRGPLKTWAADLLSANRLDRQRWLNAGRVDRIWTNHQQRKGNHGSWLWNVLMVQAWTDEWCGSSDIGR
ncbi:asparagine synthase (glutamine-hydrolyzing) [Bradyrhizobium sp. JYMT SZCCT0428]|uniref:asparagine synthase (glutamine-hydrolyzing) n=1 Tax=Bradyrhizobium sp. JYMT SZCCT0428 TaxID=2807673 RepID=UPI001BAE2D04|nr:asparagine synthase (glutamine-hydrolyzing) [Bradyrhizobium sp. JYMT SZCCT0428]MBR1156994.1 asparagine synthase (glutamine-hydrolyzing) [Bradyrhizobium sp. JYMT SZCCT0428]